ncbi:36.4 kDa proline-rich protein-like [Vanessa atalanta]|uniref:36.4 kDa proline-rich protein-like n=1 Tax=Vanessa atalanta TaxID=42275 RepID=UPI001FCD24EB|nr:36.4 kDa proline-rich protein-like [Vanessa atalanta]
MKFFVAFVAFVAVAAAMPHQKPHSNFDADLQAIMDAIVHPSTDPATALLLQEQLDTILGVLKPEEEPISVEPVIVDEAVSAPSSSLVQIIINVKPGVAGNPVVVESSPVIIPRPVPEESIDIPEVKPEPVIVVEKPVPAEPVLVAPIVPTPVVVLPDILN